MQKIPYIILISLFLFSCSEDDEKSNTCSANIEIGMKSSTATSVTLKWVETSGYGSNYEYGPKGFSLGNGIKGNMTDEEVVIENLEKGKAYDFYMQSICGDGEGIWMTKPYPLAIPLNCSDITPDSIFTSIRVDKRGLYASWAKRHDIEEWQVELVSSGNVQGSGVMTNTVENNIEISDVELPKEYDLYVRGKCIGQENFGAWVKKGFTLEGFGSDGSYWCPDMTAQVSSHDIFFNTGTNNQVAFVDEGNSPENSLIIEYGHVMVFEQLWYKPIDSRFKPSTSYELYARSKCTDRDFGEWKYLNKTITTPFCNYVNWSGGIVENNMVKLSWNNAYFHFNIDFTPYDVFTFQIEYGLEGFGLGTGKVIDINEKKFEHQIPLSNFESGKSYEFFVRTKCNDSGYGNWSHQDFFGENERLIIQIP